jgi:CubicO group peptidase (beta-lactamase class C family)
MIAVTRDGALLAHGVCASRAPGPRVEGETLFDFGPLAWRLAAIAALRLDREGAINLDTPVSEGATTLRQALHWQFPGDRAKQTYWAQPDGAQWDALAAALEQASGQSIADLLNTTLKAAGLPHARFDAPNTDIPNRAARLIKRGQGWGLAGPSNPAGLLLSLEDAVAWATAPARLLSPQTAALLEQPLPLSVGREAPFSWAAHVDRFGGERVRWMTHDGAGASAVWLAVGGLDVLVGANCAGVIGIVTQLAWEALDAFAPAPMPFAAPAIADRRPDLTQRVEALLRSQGEPLPPDAFHVTAPRARAPFMRCETVEHEETTDQVKRWHRLISATGERSIVRAIFARKGALQWLSVV